MTITNIIFDGSDMLPYQVLASESYQNDNAFTYKNMSYSYHIATKEVFCQCEDSTAVCS
jgi:hypothetical protein